MQRKRSKKKKGRATASEAVAVTPAKTGKKRHLHTVKAHKEKKKSPPWLMPLLVFVALVALVMLALLASSATPTR